jgi:hypothetical protein
MYLVFFHHSDNDEFLNVGFEDMIDSTGTPGRSSHLNTPRSVTCIFILLIIFSYFFLTLAAKNKEYITIEDDEPDCEEQDWNTIQERAQADPQARKILDTQLHILQQYESMY